MLLWKKNVGESWVDCSSIIMLSGRRPRSSPNGTTISRVFWFCCVLIAHVCSCPTQHCARPVTWSRTFCSRRSPHTSWRLATALWLVVCQTESIRSVWSFFSLFFSPSFVSVFLIIIFIFSHFLPKWWSNLKAILSVGWAVLVYNTAVMFLTCIKHYFVIFSPCVKQLWFRHSVQLIIFSLHLKQLWFSPGV